jgi:hypothetical protein
MGVEYSTRYWGKVDPRKEDKPRYHLLPLAAWMRQRWTIILKSHSCPRRGGFDYNKAALYIVSGMITTASVANTG